MSYVYVMSLYTLSSQTVEQYSVTENKESAATTTLQQIHCLSLSDNSINVCLMVPTAATAYQLSS